MFCYRCGKELRENDRFCFNCGAPVRENTGKADTGESVAGLDTQELQITGVALQEDSDAQEQSWQEQAGNQESTLQEDSDAQEQSWQEQAGNQESTLQEDSDAREQSWQEHPVTQEPCESVPEIPVDLVLKKGRVAVAGNVLHLNKKYYARKSGRKKFQEEKKPVLIPLDSILEVSVEHHKYGGRLFLSLLLFLCFAAGAFYFAHSGYVAYHVLHTPYREKELAAQESIMAVIDGDGAKQLLQYRNRQEEDHSAAEALSDNLADLEGQQAQEILDIVSRSEQFDLDVFFNRKEFSRAYQEYLQELLDAFKGDEALHSWLYSYYETTKAYGGNDFLDTDLWIYSGDGEGRFSSVLDSAGTLMDEQYDLDLYEHILFAGRIYITGADFMRLILSLPRYAVDGAVFAKAYGGVPESSEMSVPGWTGSRYEEFWLYGIDYYSVDTPMWLDYGFSAGDFSLDWNALMDERAYYDAYQSFMGKIAPGLPCYERAYYQADDASYGGMSCRLKGAEPSFRDLVASYAGEHPEFIEELKESEAYGRLLITSVDEEIAETKAQLEKLEKELQGLEEKENKLARLLADADVYRNDYALLLADIAQHTQETLRRLLFSVSIGTMCLLGALYCPCKFIGFLTRPRYLFVIRGQDMEYAFDTKRCPAEQTELLRGRLSAHLD